MGKYDPGHSLSVVTPESSDVLRRMKTDNN